MGAAGTDVALETADLVLMGDRLQLIDEAIRLSKRARRVVWQNLTFSILVIVVLVLSAFAISLPLPLGVLGHEGSTVIVVLNGLISLLLLPELQRRKKAASDQRSAIS
jgi:Cd2+/Zn2+-exporting ATPase